MKLTRLTSQTPPTRKQRALDPPGQPAERARNSSGSATITAPTRGIAARGARTAGNVWMSSMAPTTASSSAAAVTSHQLAAPALQQAGRRARRRPSRDDERRQRRPRRRRLAASARGGRSGHSAAPWRDARTTGATARSAPSSRPMRRALPVPVATGVRPLARSLLCCSPRPTVRTIAFQRELKTSATPTKMCLPRCGQARM